VCVFGRPYEKIDGGVGPLTKMQYRQNVHVDTMMKVRTVIVVRTSGALEASIARWM